MNKILYRDLKKAYTEVNLNNITKKIIDSFRQKNHDYIRNLIRQINNTIHLNEVSIHKLFSITDIKLSLYLDFDGIQ